jgi:phosphoenolpyruvate synthase/pyruvate phosphate dikinase
MEHTTSFGTKAETLAELFQLGFSVPQSFYFTVQAWRENKKELLRQIPASLAAARALAVRSSSLGEDGAFASQAGKYKSILDVPPQPARLSKAIEEVSKVLQGQDQILIQPMVDNVHMSGVVMTKSLDDGSPYYCINYDDTSGRTDTITSGTGAHKTVYIYNGVSEDDFDSPRLRALMNTITELNKL